MEITPFLRVLFTCEFRERSGFSSTDHEHQIPCQHHGHTFHSLLLSIGDPRLKPGSYHPTQVYFRKRQVYSRDFLSKLNQFTSKDDGFLMCEFRRVWTGDLLSDRTIDLEMIEWGILGNQARGSCTIFLLYCQIKIFSNICHELDGTEI